jgi:hypothetical protein
VPIVVKEMGRSSGIVCVIAGVAIAAGCGSRTGLDDVPTLLDADAVDAGLSTLREVGAADITLPPPKKTPPPAAEAGLGCEAGAPVAYLFDQNGAIHTFDPTTLETTLLGTPSCPDNGPWTISVSREGYAYLVFNNFDGGQWNIDKVDLSTLGCDRTPFANRQLGIDQDFAIAVSRSPGEERLYVYGLAGDAGAPTLATSNLTTFQLSLVAVTNPVPPSFSAFDMQADLSGHLYVLSDTGVLVELAASTGEPVGEANVAPFVTLSTSWAVMTYNQSVYMFSNDEVARFDPVTQSAVVLGSVDIGGVPVVGASAVPCYGVQGG